MVAKRYHVGGRQCPHGVIGGMHETELTKGSSYNFVSPRVVEGDCVNHVSVTLQRQQFLPSLRAPYFASSVVAPSDEFVALFIESAICQR